MRKSRPRCSIHGVQLNDQGGCWSCKMEEDRIAEEALAGRDRAHYRATAPAEMKIGVVESGAVQTFRLPKIRGRR